MPMKADPAVVTPETRSVEVSPKATRRTFSTVYKKKILEKTAPLKAPGRNLWDAIP